MKKIISNTSINTFLLNSLLFIGKYHQMTQSMFEHVMGVLEYPHLCGKGILPYLNYNDIKKLCQTSSVIKKDVISSNILRYPIYIEARIHEDHLKWHRKRTPCDYNEWREHWDYLHDIKKTYYNILDPWTIIEDDNHGGMYVIPWEDSGPENDNDFEAWQRVNDYDEYLYFMSIVSEKIYDKSCIRCGCYNRKDSYGDRTCGCETCNNSSHYECLYRTRWTDPCIHCGCMEEYKPEGERVCFCTSCKSSGCVHTSFIK